MKKLVWLFVLILVTVSFARDCRLLVLTRESYVETIQDYVDWKTKLGFKPHVFVIPSSLTEYDEIKHAISSVIDEFDSLPEFILIAGGYRDITQGYIGCSTDWYYTDFDGDERSDCWVGRFPAFDISDMEHLVYKVLTYEREPEFSDDLEWIKKGTLAIHPDGSSGDVEYWRTLYHIDTLYQNAGYTHIDTLNSTGSGSVHSAVEDGRAYLVYRGQGVEGWYAFSGIDPGSMTNFGMYPVVSGATCRTIGSFGPAWVNAQAGAIAYVGTSVVGGGFDLMVNRNMMTIGFADGCFEGEFFGQAANRGRQYVLDRAGGATERDYQSFHLLGDPTMMLWTDYPSELNVTHSPIYSYGYNSFSVNVADLASGDPIENALVCISMDTLINEYAYTDADGNVLLPYFYSGDGMDHLEVTVSKHNYRVYESFAVCHLDGPRPYLSSIWVDDTTAGNSDGHLSRSENARVRFTIDNAGTSEAHGVSVFIETDYPHVTIISDEIEIGSVGFEPITPDDGMEFRVSTSAASGDVITFALNIITDTDTFIHYYTTTEVVGANPIISDYVFSDPMPFGDEDGQISEGDVFSFGPVLQNTGSATAYDIEITFESIAKIHAVDNYLYVDSIAPGQTRIFECLTFSASPMITVSSEADIPYHLHASDNRISIIDKYGDLTVSYFGDPDAENSEWLIGENKRVTCDAEIEGVISDGDLDFDEGEVLALFFDIENIGNRTAYSTKTLLRIPSTSSDFISTVDSTVDVGDIGVGHTVQMPEPFLFRTDAIPDDNIYNIELWMFSNTMEYHIGYPMTISVIDDNNIVEQVIKPIEFEMPKAYPNPFNSSTKIEFNLDKAQNVKLDIYDIMGNVIYSFNSNLPSGMIEIPVNFSGCEGGVYLYKININNTHYSGRLLFVK